MSVPVPFDPLAEDIPSLLAFVHPLIMTGGSLSGIDTNAVPALKVIRSACSTLPDSTIYAAMKNLGAP
jgi:hypothetical protein